MIRQSSYSFMNVVLSYIIWIIIIQNIEYFSHKNNILYGFIHTIIVSHVEKKYIKKISNKIVLGKCIIKISIPKLFYVIYIQYNGLYFI